MTATWYITSSTLLKNTAMEKFLASKWLQMYEVAGLKEFVWCSKTTDLRQLGILYTGHTQKSGAVLIVNTIKTAPLFCVCPVYKFKIITLLSQLFWTTNVPSLRVYG